MIQKALPYKCQVYDAIKTGILKGQYRPGDMLSERMMSEEMGISRTPIREAMQMLAQDGWLVLETYKGAVVREFEPEYMREVQKIRRVLEILAVEDACLSASDRDLFELEQIVDRQEEIEGDFSKTYDFIALDRQFHNKIYEMSGNQTLCRLLSNYNDIISLFGIQALKKDQRSYTTVEEHRKIIEELRAGDVKKTKEAMELHMEETCRSIERWKTDHS